MSSSYTTCAACTFFRRECVEGCVFYPHFPPDNPKRFFSVYVTFGARYVAEVLNELHPSQHEEFINDLVTDARDIIRDPDGTGPVSLLQYHPKEVQTVLYNVKKEVLATTEVVSSILLPAEDVGNPSSSEHDEIQIARTPSPGGGQLIRDDQQQMNKMLEKSNEVQTSLANMKKEVAAMITGDFGPSILLQLMMTDD